MITMNPEGRTESSVMLTYKNDDNHEDCEYD